MTTLIATKRTIEEVRAMTTRIESVSEAAATLGVSASRLRTTAKLLGAGKLGGRSVAGYIVFDRHPVPVAVSYSFAT